MIQMYATVWLTMFVSPKVYLLLFLTLVLVLYHFAQPYKSRVANMLEFVVQLNLLILLLLISSAILEPFYGLPLGSLVVSSNGTCGGHEVGVAWFVWFLTPFYYFPVLLLVGVVMAVCIKRLYTVR